MIERVEQWLRDASHVVVFTGAGISVESGIPTFRDALTGLWARLDPAALATAKAFRNDPTLVWGWYEWQRAQMPHVARQYGARVVHINVIPESVEEAGAFRLGGKAAERLPQLLMLVNLA